MTDHFYACPRCGQTISGAAPRVCDACAALERDRAGGEPLRLFSPAPAPMRGQLDADAFYRCACGDIHGAGLDCPNPVDRVIE